MSTLEATPRTTDLDVRLGKIMDLIVDLDLRRRDLAVAAAGGDKSALRSVAMIDTELEAAEREQRTLAQALDRVHEQDEDAQRTETAREVQARRTRAANLARNIAAFNSEIDDLLARLALILGQRFEALRELSATNIVDRSLISKMLGRDPLTRAMHYHGLHRSAAINVGAPGSALAMAGMNRHLSAIGTAVPAGEKEGAI
jgi:hypothetical protein